MRALQITELTGPRGLTVTELPDPGPEHPMTPGQGVLIDVHAAGAAFPDVLQTRGEYQFKPPLPFVPGAEVAGVVREASEGADVKPGDRVAACTYLGGFAETAVAPAHMTLPLADRLDFEQGASLIFNYHTVYFSLVMRGRLQEGERVLVHGAAGGVGTAGLQVAKGLGADTVAVVSSDEKAAVAERAGADMVVRSDGPWKDEVKESGGVDVVLDPVGGDRFTDSLRCLRRGGRCLVVGLHRRVDPRGQGQPPAAEQHRGRGRGVGRVDHGQPGRDRRDRRGPRAADRVRSGRPDRGRLVPAGSGRRGAGAHRLTRRHRQNRADRVDR